MCFARVHSRSYCGRWNWFRWNTTFAHIENRCIRQSLKSCIAKVTFAENKSPKWLPLKWRALKSLAPTTPFGDSPLIELEPREKNGRVARRETKRLIYKLKVLGQPVTSEVRSSAEKWRKPVIADNFASDGARAKFQRPACSLRRVKYGTTFFKYTWIIFTGQKFEKPFSDHMTSLTFHDPVVPWPNFKSS